MMDVTIERVRRLTDVKPGDRAHRIDRDLDPRPVEEVGRDAHGVWVRLRIGPDTVTDPVRARWYRFTRDVTS